MAKIKKRLSEEKVYILYGHWLWCETMRASLFSKMAEFRNHDENLYYRDNIHLIDLFGVILYFRNMPIGAYWFAWYGLLYGLIEDLDKNGIVIPEILRDIDGIKDTLRHFRNATFHPQERYWSPKFIKLASHGYGLDIIHKIHRKIGEYLTLERSNFDADRWDVTLKAKNVNVR